MKITVIKKSNGKVKTMSACPWIMDEPPGRQELGRRPEELKKSVGSWLIRRRDPGCSESVG